MPLFISTLRMQKVFMKLAEPLAKDATKELRTISFAPVIPLVTPEKAFLSKRATETEEPTAAK